MQNPGEDGRGADLTGATCVVFGGASGLGEATARALAAAGGDVVVADLAAESGAAVAEAIAGEFVEADVTSAEDVARAVAAETYGGRSLRVAVTCAGIGWAERLVGRRGVASLDAFRRVVEINLVGTFNVLRLCGEAMASNEPDADGGRGVVLLTSSGAAFEGQQGQTAYAAAKAGVAGMTLPAARDLAAHGVRVVTIAPGLFDTPLLAALPEEARRGLSAAVPFPQRLGRPAEFGQLAVALATNPMMNGEVVRLDGALRMGPV
jgi:NAD(P)-dependent dehydrogenase (short-subunit alcohol dehydrogenase family)